ncbi:hypothetical protein [Sandaracinus amylolyticus]|uniref:hypothetical protein n=1 Tax=Sandaracinus amylolyticus TaxID=927083 RepID=UPI001F2E55BC|nr:hypothetical protein [Sandaracinus amylolyticus]UJR85501.1 Hypothetical protein I5071_75810 [Sandaracinus amylolyticus]
MLQRAWWASLALTWAGCYASHELETGAPTCEAPVGSGVACEPDRAVWPDGACRDASGTAIAFRVGGGLAACEMRGDASGWAARPACGEAHDGTHAASCEGATPSGPLAFAWWPTRPPFAERTFDPAPGTCEVALEAEPDGPWEPLRGVDEICADVEPSCSTPVVIDLVARGGDPCGGSEFVERCRAEVVDGRIVLRAESAPARIAGCLTELGDRVARCALPPLPVGRYEVVDDLGRTLGAITIGAEGRGGRACTELPIDEVDGSARTHRRGE